MTPSVRGNPRRGVAALLWALVAHALLATLALAQPDLNAAGYGSLVARLGPGNVPTGASVIVAHVEGTQVSGQNVYIPDTAGPPFSAITFTPMILPALVSGHATNVGIYMYGASSLAPGVRDVRCWLADHWLQDGQLRVGLGWWNAPLPTPPGVRVFNNSWVGTGGTPAWDNEALRRADLLAERDDALIICAVGSTSSALLSSAYNGLAVATDSGQWGGYLTHPSLDGGGRTKPEIVAPSTSRSTATGFVSSGATLLFDAANAIPIDRGGANATRSEVVKACLLTGAAHRTTWSNGAPTTGENRGVATRPLDPVFGADKLNVDQSHRVLTGAQCPGSDDPTLLEPAPSAAWDYPALATEGRVYQVFALPLGTGELIATATWNRRVADNLLSVSSANIDLELLRVDEHGALHPLTGPDGEGSFTQGNVASRSAVDNIEHLRVLGLAPGRYALEVKRLDTLSVEGWPVAIAWRMPEPCLGDTNADNLVDFTDLNAVLSHYGLRGPPASVIGDLDADGEVDFADLNIVLSHYGSAC